VSKIEGFLSVESRYVLMKGACYFGMPA